MDSLLIIALVIIFSIIALLGVGGYSLSVFLEQLVQIACPEEF